MVSYLTLGNHPLTSSREVYCEHDKGNIDTAFAQSVGKSKPRTNARLQHNSLIVKIASKECHLVEGTEGCGKMVWLLSVSHWVSRIIPRYGEPEINKTRYRVILLERLGCA